MFGQGLPLGFAGSGGVEADFLLIAGGGTGYENVYGGGGAGAGGLRTSYGTLSGGGSQPEEKLLLKSGTTYTITIGGSSTDSSIIGGEISLTSIAGGNSTNPGNGSATGSNDPNSGQNTTGASGGSGTGGWGYFSYANGGPGTAGQGYKGGDVIPYYSTAGSGYWFSRKKGGGGGGAGGAGKNGGYSSNPVYGSTVAKPYGDGGVGLAVNILSATNASTSNIGEVSGSDVYYAGGGGASTVEGSISSPPSSEMSDGGIGGGGRGMFYNNDNPWAQPWQMGESGLANSGGGGGGSYGYGGYVSLPHLYGGSGVVILRMPTSNYSGTTTGSPDVYTEGSDTVIVFKGSGTYTH
jgi:hypothetical protein